MKSLTSALLLTSLALGILADILLRAEPWGINVPAGLFPLAAALVWLHVRSHAPLAKGWQLTLGACLATALLLAWRSSALLQVANILFVLVTLLATVSRPATGSLRNAMPSNLASAALVYGFHGLLGSFPLVADVLHRASPPTAGHAIPLRLAKGAVLALPLIVVFGILFMAADPVFDHDVHALLDIDFPSAASHLFLTAVVAWLLGGAFRGRFVAEQTPVEFANIPQRLQLGVTELAVVLGSVIVLFVAFLTVQFRYLFGGAPLVQVVPGLTYAQYARSGFFELVTASAIVLPLLLTVDWLLLPVAKRDRTAVHALAFVLIALVFLLMASALQRMLLYQREFGLTELRFFVTAFMGWLALMFLLYLVTVVRGRREYFLSTGIAVSFIFLLGLNILNPDAWIARTNIARAMEGKQFDASYNAHLSYDAIPILTQSISSLNIADREKLLEGLSDTSCRIAEGDWRGWTLSRSVARDYLASLTGQ